jgi:hypothetical protein
MASLLVYRAAAALPRCVAGCRRAPARAALCAAAPAPRRFAASLASRPALATPLGTRRAAASRRVAAARPPPGARAAADGAMAAALAAWEATQRVVLWATAAGIAACAVVATNARGRAALRTAWSDFQARAARSACACRAGALTRRARAQMSPEGAQVASLIQYLLLILLARVLEFLTGARGILTFVYLGIFATQVLHWLRTGLPGPDEARARVEALEAGLPYAGPPPGPEAQAAFAAAFPALQSEALAWASAAVLRGADAATPGTAFLTRATLAFAADGDAGPRLALPLAACADVAAAPDGDGVVVAAAPGAAALRLDPSPHAGPDRPRISMSKVVAGYWKRTRSVAPAP